ncbi:MAG: radical SAM protein [Deltaproteobacteria bacterium]|nr:radical SAM protein [Deltaproteobacteria bacterium]
MSGPKRELPVVYSPGVETNAEQSHATKGLVRLTMACNERCPFCNVPMEDYPERHTPEAELDAAVTRFAAEGEKTLTISGGEPTLLRDRLLALARRARAAGIELIEVQTNATLIDVAYATDLAEAGVTSAFVSLLSDLPELHDELAGLAGAFEPCLTGIDALLDAGIRVALNPVVAASTQARLPDYVDFVARRLPRVRSISVSAVQPHGRASSRPELLPDYAVLGPAIREARHRAEAAGIELLNPYCGVPVCVGWEDALERSVEAIEAREAGQRDESAPGVVNRGDKRHGPPCDPCVHRGRCGGAWHAYWAHRAGSGLAPTARVFDPFSGRPPSPLESVVDAQRLDGRAERDLAAADRPAVWLRLARLVRGDGERARRAGCTHLALCLSPSDLVVGEEAYLELLAIDREGRRGLPQHRLRVSLGLRPDTSPRRMVRALFAASAAGIGEVRLLSRDHRRWSSLLQGVERSLPRLDVALVAPPEPDR